MTFASSLRTRILLIVLGVAVIPLALIGAWMSGSASRSGETLLRTRLSEDLARSAAAIQIAWVRYRSDLLDFAESEAVSHVLRGAAPDAAAVEARFAGLRPAVYGVVVRDAAGRELLNLRRPPLAADLTFGVPFTAAVPLYDTPTGERVGTLEAVLPIQALRSDRPEAPTSGAVLAALDPRTNAALLPIPFEPVLLEQERFEWNGDEWLALRRRIVEPQIDLVVAAPLTPYAAPFRRAARESLLALAIVAAIGLLLTAVLTHRVTRSLERLAGAADAVSAGDLTRKVKPEGSVEIRRLAAAFNTMTAGLRTLLRRLAERESLSAVNEFAAALAHEVRNPLSSIQLDLQQVEERLPPDLKSLQSQALDELRRLERTVAGALETARSGRLELREIDLMIPIRDAVHAARPFFDERGATLTAPGDECAPVVVEADADALQRVILNLLRNAAAALPPGGTAVVEVDETESAAVVRVEDSGEGIDPEHLPNVFDPFYSTRAGGTGVGLTVARRIVVAHGGTVQIDSSVGVGTTVEIRLPRSPLERFDPAAADAVE